VSPTFVKRPLPARLGNLDLGFAHLYVTGTLNGDARAVAIVGARDCSVDAAAFASELAQALVHAGIVVVSGGAQGIDAAAHRGALEAGGSTWLVSPAPAGRVYPPEHASLFADVVLGGGAVVTPFAPEEVTYRSIFLSRNRLLVGLSEAVVIVQAEVRSGTRSSARWARKLRRPLFVVAPSPWLGPSFEGSRVELDLGARPITSVDRFLKELGVAERGAPGVIDRGARAVESRALAGAQARALSSDELAVVSALPRGDSSRAEGPAHVDDVVRKTELSAGAVATALLTLALENVVVEGPSGFFRRANPR
jgi:DNA processing protein